jgi:hypothetical protein
MYTNWKFSRRFVVVWIQENRKDSHRIKLNESANFSQEFMIQ